MSAKVFLDTNIFVYAFDRKAPEKARIADGLIRGALQKQNGVVSYQVVQEFFNVAFRRFPRSFAGETTSLYLSTVFWPLLKVHSSRALLTEALEIRERHKFSWYDSLILAAALQAGCSRLLTEDLQHGQRFGALRVENPFLGLSN